MSLLWKTRGGEAIRISSRASNWLETALCVWIKCIQYMQLNIGSYSTLKIIVKDVSCIFEFKYIAVKKIVYILQWCKKIKELKFAIFIFILLLYNLGFLAPQSSKSYWGVRTKCKLHFWWNGDIYIKWKLLMSSFYWQKYCHPWVYKCVL